MNVVSKLYSIFEHREEGDTTKGESMLGGGVDQRVKGHFATLSRKTQRNKTKEREVRDKTRSADAILIRRVTFLAWFQLFSEPGEISDLTFYVI
jgi:hypothetical protein